MVGGGEEKRATDAFDLLVGQGYGPAAEKRSYCSAKRRGPI